MQTLDRETEQVIDAFLTMLACCHTIHEQRQLVWTFAEKMVRSTEKHIEEKKEKEQSIDSK